MKTSVNNIFNQSIDVMHIKGSGWNMNSIDEVGLPLVELNPLLKTINLKKLSDFEMMNLLRRCLLKSDTTLDR